jgi:formylglycine-generating enzyme
MFLLFLACSGKDTTSTAPIAEIQKEVPEIVAPPAPPPPPPPPPKVVSSDGIEMLDCPADTPDGMSCVPGGKMKRGTNEEHSCGQGENKRYKTKFGPEEEIWVQTFLMDKTEVTYEAYQLCLTEKKCDYAKPAYSDFNRPTQPMMGASWYAANKYCQAQGKRLPTEAEWERAARGPNGDTTPFGMAEVTCDNAVIKDASGRSCGVKKKGGSPEKGRVLEVALKPAGYYGLYDMVGNAEEWVSDWFAPSYESCGEDCKGTSPKGPCAGETTCKKFAIRDGKALKMVKGGSWYWPAQDATGWHRRPHVPTNKPYHHFGFRCASSIVIKDAIVE